MNQKLPFLSSIIVCGSRTPSGVGYLVISPVFGSSLPMWFARLPVYQMLPSLPTIWLCGPVPESSGNFVNSPFFGLSRPT